MTCLQFDVPCKLQGKPPMFGDYEACVAMQTVQGFDQAKKIEENRGGLSFSLLLEIALLQPWDRYTDLQNDD